MSSGNRRDLRVKGGGQGRGRRERGDRERERRAEDVGGRAGRARRAEDVGREGIEEMDRLEGNGIVERENIRGGRGGRGGQRGRGGQGVRGGRRGRLRVEYTCFK